MPRAVQQVFQQVGGVGQRCKTKSGGAAFDRMGRAKDGIKGFAVRRLQVKPQKQLFHVRQQFIGFFKKGLVKLGNVHVEAFLVRLWQLASQATPLFATGSASLAGRSG